MSLLGIRHRIFYGWIVAIAGLLLAATGIGMRFSFGVFFKAIENEFGLSRGATSTIFSAHMLLCAVITFLGGWALDKYGPRTLGLLLGSFTGLSLLLTSHTISAWQLFISYSLLLSLGTGALFTVVNSTASRWFDKKRGFVLGITTSAGALGTIVMAPFATYLLTSFDWRAAFTVMGLIGWLVMIPLAMLLKKSPGDIGQIPDGVESVASKITADKKSNLPPTGLSLLQASGTRSFWFLGFVSFIMALNVHLIMVHAVPYTIDMGISPADAAVILSLIGGGSILGRLVSGKVSDVVGRKVPAIACALLQSVVLIWLLWVRDLWMFNLFAIAFGFSWGGLGTMIAALVGDIFGMQRLGTILGAVNVGYALGAAVGPAMGGFIFDISGNYFTSFALGSVLLLVATPILALTRRQMDTQRK